MKEPKLYLPLLEYLALELKRFHNAGCYGWGAQKRYLWIGQSDNIRCRVLEKRRDIYLLEPPEWVAVWPLTG